VRDLQPRFCNDNDFRLNYFIQPGNMPSGTEDFMMVVDDLSEEEELLEFYFPIQ